MLGSTDSKFNVKLNREDFEPLMPPKKRSDAMILTFTTGGRITLNTSLRKKLPELAFSLELSRDRERLILDPKGEPKLMFPKNGDLKAKELIQALAESGMALPAHFEIDWNEKENCWYGIRFSREAPPDPREIEKALQEKGEKPARGGRRSGKAKEK